MRKLLVGSLLGMLLCVSIGSADLVAPRKFGAKENIPGLGIRSTIERFKANEPASVIISGDGDTCLGLYIFDGNGNCVAKDDFTSPHSSDDLAVEWIPPETAPYAIEVRNAGITFNAYEFAVR